MAFIQGLILFLLLISILVFVHEYGHYFFARINGVHVEKFSIGFGNPLLSFKDKKGTIWSFSPILLGGFVKMKGDMMYAPKEDRIKADRDSFLSKNNLQKMSIIAGGPLFNLIFAFLLFIITGLAFAGRDYKPIIKDTTPNSIAQISGIKSGDIILSVNSIPIKTWSDFSKYIRENPNKSSIIIVQRGDINKSISLRVSENESNNGFIGVILNPKEAVRKKVSISDTISFGYNNFLFINKAILGWIKIALLGKASLDDIGSPVKIAEVSNQFYNQGLMNWIFFMAAISVNLAIMNLLPIPALDGGHLLFYAIESITRKSIHYKFINYLNTVSFIALMILMIALLFRDIFRTLV